MKKNYSLKYICDYLGAEFMSASRHSDLEKNSHEIQINGVASPDKAKASDLSFISSKTYLSALETTQACAIILTSDLVEQNPVHSLIVDNPYIAYARLTALFAKNRPEAGVHKVGVHSTATISDSAQIGKNCSIGANVVIADEVIIGDCCIISAGVVIDESVRIGNHCLIYPNVSLYHDVVIGNGCVIHSGAVIGADGFGFAPTSDGFIKIHQLGSVQIGNGVEIGANTAIDRGALDNTEIHDGVKIDNLVHIAHNCVIGENSAFAAQVGIAGTSKTGKNCIFGGQVGVSGHLNITDNVQATGKTLLVKHIKKPGVYSSGTVVSDNLSWRKNTARFNQLNDMHKRIASLERALKKNNTKD